MKRNFYVGAFFATLFLNLPLFILSFVLMANLDWSLIFGFLFLVLANALLNGLFFLIFKNRDIYYSLLYGQITGLSFAGILLTMCGGLLFFT